MCFIWNASDRTMAAIQNARNLDFSKIDSILGPELNITNLILQRPATVTNSPIQANRNKETTVILFCAGRSDNANIRLILAVSCFGRVTPSREKEQQLTYDTNRFPYESQPSPAAHIFRSAACAP